jgi:signal transduction histidine kinase
VYLISENKFRQSNESTSIKQCINEIVEMTFRDLKTRNIDLQVTIAPEVPESISCDLHKAKQVIINMFMQGVN